MEYKYKDYKVIDLYVYTKWSILDISAYLDIPPGRIQYILDNHLLSVKNMVEARLIKLKDMDISTMVTDKEIVTLFNKDDKESSLFLSRISSAEQELTEYELSFIYHMLHTDSPLLSLSSADLDVGLNKGVGPLVSAYENALTLRSSYLLSKCNIADKLAELKAAKLGSYKLSKEMVQYEIVQEINRLKLSNDQKDKQLLSRKIEMLGKTIQGCFDNKISIQKVDPSDAIEKLIEMAQADIDLLPAGSPTEEVWESKDE